MYGGTDWGHGVRIIDGPAVYPRVYGGTSTWYDWKGVYKHGQVYPRVYGGTHHPDYRCLKDCRRRVYPRVYGGTRLPREDENSLNLRVYPRVYGGTDLSALGSKAVALKHGLSPRVRGNLGKIGAFGLPGRCRVYPRVYGGTYLGQCGHTAAPGQVYPRVYGGTVFMVWLSPGVRGRSIPACTGEPRSCHRTQG